MIEDSGVPTTFYRRAMIASLVLGVVLGGVGALGGLWLGFGGSWEFMYARVDSPAPPALGECGPADAAPENLMPIAQTDQDSADALVSAGANVSGTLAGSVYVGTKCGVLSFYTTDKNVRVLTNATMKFEGDRWRVLGVVTWKYTQADVNNRDEFPITKD